MAPPNGGKETPLPLGLVQRVSGTHAQDPLLGWFGPGRPLTPVAQQEAGRRWDYPTGYNLLQRPRPHEPLSFETLRRVSDPSEGGLDLLRLAIETRKDQMAKLRWGAQYKKPFGKRVRPPADKACEEVENFFRKPNREDNWSTWVGMLLEDLFVIDAPTVYLRPNRGGGVYSCDVIDGATIQRKLDQFGRTPLPPDPAYQQIVKGVPMADYTTDELLYRPRNKRAHKAFGYGPVEQITTTINIAIRRQSSQLSYFTEGNIPEAIIGAPPDWTPSQIQDFQNYWDALLEGNQAARRHAKFVPGGLMFQPTRTENGLLDQFDEWLARIVCYAFSLPPMPFVRMVNRATAETHYDMAIEEGLAPLMAWVKDLMDELIRRVFGREDIEFVWEDHRQLKPAEQAQLDNLYVSRGVKSLDDWRIELGLEPLGVGPAIFGVGPMGLVFIEDILKARAMGQSSLPMPDPMMGGMVDPMAGVPPEALQAAGVAPEEEMTPEEEEARAAELQGAAEAASRAKVHPKVARMLREVETRLNGPDYP